jgi:hypothetical protein
MYLYVCTQIMDWAHAYINVRDISPIRKRKPQEMAADDETVWRYELPSISGKSCVFKEFYDMIQTCFEKGTGWFIGDA